ncbi:MAG: hypothetical protein K6C95_00750 [Lachnospiraceae bacterium]|nr:hypothetical protein [Lachnospiraceae bacterium]
MKALVLENRKGSSTVLTENGSVVRVDGEYEVGRKLILKEKNEDRKGKVVNGFAKRIIAAAAAAVFFIASAGGFCYETAYACSYVSLDVNPSIEFSLNRMDKVLSVKPMNEDAEAIVDRLVKEDIKGKSLSVAISKTREVVKEMDLEGDDDDKTYLVDISSDSERRTKRLTREIESAFDDDADETEADKPQTKLVLVNSSVNDRNTAQSLGISTGRYTAMKQAREENGDDDIDEHVVGEYKSKAVREIVKDSGAKAVAKNTADNSAAAASTGEPKPAQPVVIQPAPAPEPPAQEIVPEEQPAPAPQPAPQEKKKPESGKKKKSDKKDEDKKEEENDASAGETGDASEGTTTDPGTGSTEAAGEDEGFASEDASAAGSTESGDPSAASTGDTAGEAASQDDQTVTDGSEGGSGATDTAASSGEGSGAESGDENEQTNDASEGSGATDESAVQDQSEVQTCESAEAANSGDTAE